VIVVADTSVILNLCCVGQQELLPPLFSDIFIPTEVRQEFERAVRSYSRFAALSLPVWLRERQAHFVPAVLRQIPTLDEGEMAAIALALELKANAVLIDERAGRHAVQLFKMTPIGVLGILLRSRQTGRLTAIAPVMDQLERQVNFWVAPDLRREALRLAGEGD
jgi:hypothetical protein